MRSVPHARFAWSVLLCVPFLLHAHAGPAHAETVAVANGQVGVLGTINSGGLTSTWLADGDAEKIAEAKDATGNYRIDWSWSFYVPAAARYTLRIRAQATHTKRGMDGYEFRMPDGTVLGVVDVTTMSDYDFAIPATTAEGPLTIRVQDTNPADDARRANQLWVDYLAIVGDGAAPTALGVPTDLTATPAADGVLVLNWTDNATAEEAVEVERDDGSGFALVASLDPDATSYVDVDVQSGNTYRYRVRATKGAEVSDYSNVAVATAGTVGGGGGTGPLTDKVIIGYYPSWAIYNARKYYVSDIPFDTVTHVNYAFANIDPATGGVIVGDSFADETNRKDPETDYGLPPGNLHQLTYYRDVGHGGPAQEHLKVLISVGGWTWSENFSDIALTPESRGIFAESLKTFVDAFDLDGADIDWEYPTGDPADCGEDGNVCRAVDPVNNALLMLAIRTKLDELDPSLELTVALPADYAKIEKILPPMVENTLLVDDADQPLTIMRDPVTGADVPLGTLTAEQALTRINVMAYDFAGAPFGTLTRHHSPLYGYAGPSGDPAAGEDPDSPIRFNAHYAMQAYRYVQDDYVMAEARPGVPPTDGSIAMIPAEKLVLGLPIYGRGFASVDPQAYDGFPGLFQFTDENARRRVPKGTYDGGKWGNTGTYAYWDILLNHGGDEDQTGNNLHPVEPVPGTPYGPYVLENDLFIGFDDAVQVEDKVDYVVDQGFGGVMVWDLPSDLSTVQVKQGIAGAAAAYPSKSLMKRIAARLEAAFPQQ